MSNIDFPEKPNYKILEKLGQGSFGSAYKVLNEEDNKIYVIKKILLKGEINKIKDEAKILSTLNSKYIVKYFDSFTDKDSFNIIMEYCDGMDLKKYITVHKNSNNMINKREIYHIITRICLGLKEAHEKCLIHRDLKPENIFLCLDSNVKIGDFGIAKQLNNLNEYAETKIGTIIYMAPERIKGEKYTNKVDIWSLGCIIHELCTLNYCFYDKSIDVLIKKIKECKYSKIDEKIYGEDLQCLIELLLDENVKQRPDIEGVLKYIEHFATNIKNINLFDSNVIMQNYIIEKNIISSMNILINDTIYKRQRNFDLFKLITVSVLCIIIPAAGIIGSIFVKTKANFIDENMEIINEIESKLMAFIVDHLDKKIIKEKIIIYNNERFNENIIKIKNKLMEKKYINKLKKIIANNYNILLVGNTNVGKSTLINEFLNLSNSRKAKEGDGGPTQTIDFTPYKAQKNNKNFTLFDTNGITNNGENSIDKKKTKNNR